MVFFSASNVILRKTGHFPSEEVVLSVALNMGLSLCCLTDSMQSLVKSVDFPVDPFLMKLFKTLSISSLNVDLFHIQVTESLLADGCTSYVNKS